MPTNPPAPVISMALTFGSDYAYGKHPRLGKLAHPSGYIVVTAPADVHREFCEVICGRSDNGGIAFAFDYPLEQFEAEQVPKYGYIKLATFSSLPVLP